MWFEQRIEVIPAVDVLGEGAVRLERGTTTRSSSGPATR